MSEQLLSVGLDVGTTSTQMILSRLQVENRASNFAVPELAITGREILYKSPVHFTPLLDESHVDAEKLRQLIEEEYRNAGIRRQQVDTGAVIITGETSRKENARAVLHALSDFAGDFVVATAGPDLESVLAARGAGVIARSENQDRPILHMDIGGGTSNLALIREGKITATGCLNVGGRLVKLDETGVITYVSPVLSGLTPLKPGKNATNEALISLAQMLAQVLEMAAGRREKTALFHRFLTEDTKEIPLQPGEIPVVSFSGGVADCIKQDIPWQEYGDIGPLLGKAIRESALCRGDYLLGEETIRATVIGAGCHSTQLSGSTVFYRNVAFPLKNLPVMALTQEEQETELSQILREKQRRLDGPGVLALPGILSPSYTQVERLAEQILAAMGDQPLLISMEQDMAKALGQALALRLPEDIPVLCIDRVKLKEGDYLDVGAPVGAALPVVVKTLALSG